jgi:hypothetical protein
MRQPQLLSDQLSGGYSLDLEGAALTCSQINAYSSE